MNPNEMKYDERDVQVIKNGMHFDDTLSAFTAQQLTFVRAKALEVKKPPMSAFSVFPVQTDVPPGAEVAHQIVYDGVGMADIISNFSDDLPRVDVYADKIAVNVHTLGDSFGYNENEIKNAQMAGTNLSTRKALMAKRGIDLKLNSLAWYGDKARGIVGFLDNENISECTLKGDGTGSSTKLADKTVAQILRDIKELLQTVQKATNNVEKATALYLAPDAFAHLATTPLNDNSDTTILDFVSKTHPQLRKIEEVGELASSDGKSDYMIAGVFDPEYVAFEIPERYRQLPPQVRNLETVINCTSRAIGVTVTIPMAFAKAKGC